MKAEDRKQRHSYELAGEMFGSMLVIEKLEDRYISPKGKKHVRWKCRCVLCGRDKIATTNNLCMGHSDSCWCQSYTPEIVARRAKGNIKERAGFVELIGTYKRNARKRGLCFELSDEECDKLFKNNCHYCGNEPSYKITKSAIPYVYNGIDRKDNSKGYTFQNSESCCGICNRAKVDLSYEEFLNLVSKIYKNRVENNGK